MLHQILSAVRLPLHNQRSERAHSAAPHPITIAECLVNAATLGASSRDGGDSVFRHPQMQ